MLAIFMLFVFLATVPIALGLPWTNTVKRENQFKILACLPIGYFIELAIFHFLAVPFSFLGTTFKTLVIAYICILGYGTVLSIWFAIKHKLFHVQISKLRGWDNVYLVIFLILFALQLYNVAVRDTTYWSYDDASYVTLGADAIRYNRLLTIDTDTGIATLFSARAALQSSLLFPGFLSYITGIPATTMNRTALEIFDVVLAYSAYGYLSSVIIKKNENRFIFLILLSVLHIFGYYSQYSITFRILGPNYQGKAIVASSLFPIFFSIMIQKLQEEYDRKTGILLLLLSTAATGLTLFGAATFILNTTLTIILSLFRKERKWKHLWYLAWGYAMPVLYGGVYFIYKYFRW